MENISVLMLFFAVVGVITCIALVCNGLMWLYVFIYNWYYGSEKLPAYSLTFYGDNKIAMLYDIPFTKYFVKQTDGTFKFHSIEIELKTFGAMKEKIYNEMFKQAYVELPQENT